jgi:hypothetical protein
MLKVPCPYSYASDSVWMDAMPLAVFLLISGWVRVRVLIRI